jgi:hypothetical protein
LDLAQKTHPDTGHELCRHQGRVWPQLNTRFCFVPDGGWVHQSRSL